MLFMSELIATVDECSRVYSSSDIGRVSISNGVVMGLNLVGHVESNWEEYQPLGNVVERSWEMPPLLAENIIDFYMTCYGSYPPEENWDCHSFQGYAMGWLNEMTGSDTIAVAYTDRLLAADLDPFKGYIVQKELIENRHSIITLTDGECISVFGERKPLVVASCEDVLHVFGAGYFRKNFERRPIVRKKAGRLIPS
jgi:hypothetical protein